MNTVALGDVCRITMGQAPAGASYNTDNIGLPLVAGAGDFSLGRIATKKSTTAAVKICAPGDIILSIRASIGAKAWADDKYCLGRGVAGLRGGPILDSRYLWHWLSANEAGLRAKGRGATFLQVNRADIAEMPMRLPSLDEQRRIAAILDQAALLTTVREEAIQLSISLGPSLFAAGFGQPLWAGGAWPQVSLGDLARIIRGASPRPAGDPRFFGGHIPWLKISDVTATRGREVRDIASGVTDAGRERSVLLPPQTLILTNSATVGIAKIIGPATCVHDGFLAFLDLDDRVDQVWLWAALQASRDRLVALAPEGTQKNLNGPIVKAVKISLPPIEMQRQFATKLRKIESHVALYESALSEAQALATSLHDKAFSGQL